MKYSPILRNFALAICLAGALPAIAAAPQPGAIKQTSGTFKFRDYGAPLPATWLSQPPSSSMRIAQYKVPAVRSAGEGELVVFYFGKGQGGPVDANIDRWTSQFTGNGGKPVKPTIVKFRVAGLAVTTVELFGNYARGVGMGPQGAGKPNQTLLVAVIETPEGNLTFQLHGGKETVDANRKAFEGLVKGFRKTA